MYTWNMEQNTAIKALSALAHDGRLTLIRMLIVAGDEGIGAGELATKASVGTTTASAQLTALAHAGLVSSRREGRMVTYYADYNTLRSLLGFLIEDCCQGRAEVCNNLLGNCNV